MDRIRSEFRKGNRIIQRLPRRLYSEGDLRIACAEKPIFEGTFTRRLSDSQLMLGGDFYLKFPNIVQMFSFECSPIPNRWPSTVQTETPQ